MKRQFKSKTDCSQQVTPNKNSSTFIEKFGKADLESLKIFAEASNQSDLDLRADEKAI
jgi:hypothetical protein